MKALLQFFGVCIVAFLFVMGIGIVGHDVGTPSFSMARVGWYVGGFFMSVFVLGFLFCGGE